MNDPLVQNVNVSAVQRDVRWDLWHFSLERIAERPLAGGGFGRASFNLLYRDYHLSTGSPLWHAHNMVINKGIQMGVPGVVAFLALWLAMAIAAYRIRTRPDLRPWAIACLAMMAGVFMRNMTDDFFIRDHALMFWLLCGALLGAAREEEA
jgi:O-antigen ligase